MPSFDTQAARDELGRLLRHISVRRGAVVLASGAVSDFYVDCRQTTLHATGARLVGALIATFIEELRAKGTNIVAIGGLTLGADPIATAGSLATSHRLGTPVHAFIVRKQAKDHGTANAIEGLANLPSGASVLIVEDTITTGQSALRAVDEARRAGLTPAAIWALVDRDEGGATTLRNLGLPCRFEFSRADLFDDEPAR